MAETINLDALRAQLPERDEDAPRETWESGPILLEDLRPGDQAVIIDSSGTAHNVAITSNPVIRIVRKVSVEYTCPTLRNQGTTRDGVPVASFVKHVPPVDISDDESAQAAKALMAFQFDFDTDDS